MKPAEPTAGPQPAEPWEGGNAFSEMAGKLQDKLEDHIRFEDCIAQLSVRFINLPEAEVDGAIETAQQSFCEALGLDRSAVYQEFKEEPGAMLLTHLYELKDSSRTGHLWQRRADSRLRSSTYWFQDDSVGQADYARVELRRFFPWTYQQIERGEPAIIPSIDELPAEAAQDRDTFRRYGIQSSVLMPLRSGSTQFGCISFGAIREPRRWSAPEIKRFRFVADVFANALIRKRTDTVLKASEQRFRQVAETTNDFIWEVNSQGLYTYTSPSVEKILGYSPGELTGKVRFYDLFVPDAREALKAAALEVFAARQTFRKMPNANLAKDGRIVYLETTGVPVLDEAGNLVGYRGADTDVTERRLAEQALNKSYAEIQQLKDRLQAESDYLRAEIKVSHAHGKIIGRSQCLRRVLYQSEQVASADCPVLITGETGTGKELIAQEIHRLSARKDRMMVLVNCAALPSALVESELFGRDRGAYTGALTSQVGRFEVANGSTIFLDEIGELSMELQAKLLRVLQHGEFQRLGSPKTHKVDVRVIAATNRDLAEEVRKGRFRDDLYYRLKVFPIEVPPLRERVEDIPMLVSAFLEEFSVRMGKKITKISRKIMEQLQAHSWPGNIRELRNVIEHSVILTNGDTLKLTGLGTAPTREPQPVTLAEAEREHILKTLESTGWRIKGPHGAAKRLDLQPSTLYSRMQKLRIPHRRQKDESGPEE